VQSILDMSRKKLDILFFFYIISIPEMKKNEKLNKIKQNIELFDVYKNLLNTEENKILTDYYENDYSICEIAKKTGLTRQRISEILKNIEKKTKNFESKLRLLEKKYFFQKNYDKFIAAIKNENNIENLKLKINKFLIKIEQLF